MVCLISGSCVPDCSVVGDGLGLATDCPNIIPLRITIKAKSRTKSARASVETYNTSERLNSLRLVKGQNEAASIKKFYIPVAILRISSAPS
jgi:hypothetical protein